jgi:hypothetical protein
LPPGQRSPSGRGKRRPDALFAASSQSLTGDAGATAVPDLAVLVAALPEELDSLTLG